MTSNQQHNKEYHVQPVGIVSSEIREPVHSAGDDGISLNEKMAAVQAQHQRIKTLMSEIEIFSEYEGILEGVEDFSHIMVLYWPHLIDEQRRGLRQTRPMGRADMPVKGIFSTCSPARPNPVLVSTVRLLERKGNILRVRGFEAIDGSPVIDIKPFVRMSHGADNPVVPDWMKQIHRELESGQEKG